MSIFKTCQDLYVWQISTFKMKKCTCLFKMWDGTHRFSEFFEGLCEQSLKAFGEVGRAGVLEFRWLLVSSGLWKGPAVSSCGPGGCSEGRAGKATCVLYSTRSVITQLGPEVQAQSPCQALFWESWQRKKGRICKHKRYYISSHGLKTLKEVPLT